jgi:hypothetical protein
MRNAFLTNVTVAEKSAAGTKQPVVVKRLDHGHSRRTARVVSRGRNERKRIVEVHYVGRVPCQNIAQLTIGAARPGRAPAKAYRVDKGVCLNLVIVPQILEDLMPGFTQKLDFGLAYYIFAAAPLIEVVRHENSHDLSFSSVLAIGLSILAPAAVETTAGFFR